MKNLFYVVAGLLIVIWFIVFLSFEVSGYVHLLLAVAGIFILIRVLFGKQLSDKRR